MYILKLISVNCRRFNAALKGTVILTCLLTNSFFCSLPGTCQRVVSIADSVSVAETVTNPVTADSLSRDSVRGNRFEDYVKKVMQEGYIRSKADYNRTKELYHRENLIDEMTITLQQAKNYLRNVPDTSEVNQEINEIHKRANIAVDGIFVKQGMSQTYRNLTTASRLLRELLDRAEERQKSLENYRKDLVSFKISYDSLNADSLLYLFSEDSAAIMKQLTNIVVLANQVKPIDSLLRSTLDGLEELKFPMFRMVSVMRTNLEQIENYQRDLSANLFRREVYNIWDDLKTARPFPEIARISASKGWLVLSYYVEARKGKITFMILLLILATLFIRALKHRQIEAGNYAPNEEGQLVLKIPVLSAYIIVVSIVQFIFDDPPFIFRSLLWITSGIALTVVFWRFIIRFWMTMWLLVLFVFVLSVADNLILQASRPERLGILAVSIAGIMIGLYFLNSGRLNELRERYIIHFMRLMIVLELVAVVTNLYGRYNFTKSVFVAGYAGVIIGIIFLWTVRLINESLALASKSYTRPDRKLFYINFRKVGGKVPAYFYVLLVIGWFIQVGGNFYAYKQVTTPLSEFLLSERTLGDYTFSVKSILVFLIILVVAALLSKLVSYFSPDVYHTEGVAEDKKNSRLKMGSWILLIRIFIISMGLFLAFAAAGIPVDRITIILGALGVGIGLGLQALVNNLVSGLIIAFEKPVNVGDIVEIDGKPGVMKSIGFRSSTIVMVDGAQVVIPNGDLLNSRLINWSAGQGNRRVELLVGVAYGTDLEKTRSLLLKIMQENERVLKVPPPMVLVQEFKDSSIEFRCNFWVGNFMEWAIVKSKLIRTVVTSFRENGIEIPFPQRDLYIKKLPADMGENRPGEQVKGISTEK